MFDPLRSLAELVRTLASSRGGKRAEVAGAQRSRGGAEKNSVSEPSSSAVGAAQPLRERLRQRLRAVDGNDPRRAREAFVETVLAAEFGDAVTLDPAMNEIVRRVAQQLGGDPATERDLRLLFEELVRS